MDVKCKEELSEAEIEELTREWEGQESDGWGEGFEQQDILVYEAELYVNFWSDRSDFFIMTEKQLKGGMMNEGQSVGMVKGII